MAGRNYKIPYKENTSLRSVTKNTRSRAWIIPTLTIRLKEIELSDTIETHREYRSPPREDFGVATIDYFLQHFARIAK